MNRSVVMLTMGDFDSRMLGLGVAIGLGLLVGLQREVADKRIGQY